MKRGYTAEDVVRLRGSLRIEHTLAKRGAEKLWKLTQERPFVNSLGALTGNQAMQQVKAGVPAIYLSGWQVAADANDSLADVPRPVALRGVIRADGGEAHQQRTDARRPDPDHGRQGETWTGLRRSSPTRKSGFGGVLNAYELMKLDDRGRRRRRALRGPARLGEEMRPHGRQGAGADAGSGAEAGRRAARGRRHWACRRCCSRAPTPRPRTSSPPTSTRTTSHSSPASAPPRASTARARASTRRSPAASRTRNTPTWCGARPARPTSAFAQQVRRGHRKKYPDKMLAYNCSPSFNWKRNLDDATIAKFQRELGAMGYKFQFITLAGFHALNYSMFELAHGYARDNMSAFVELQQKEFAAAEKGFTAVKHQREVGTGYFDEITQVVTGGKASTTALHGSTEDEQFFDEKKKAKLAAA